MVIPFCSLKLWCDAKINLRLVKQRKGACRAQSQLRVVRVMNQLRVVQVMSVSKEKV